MLGSASGYADIADDAERPFARSPRFKRGAFGVVSAFAVVLLIARTSMHAVDVNDAMVTQDAKVAPGPLARDSARGQFASDISNDDHTVQKLENQTDLDDDSSLLNQGNLTEVEVIDNNGTAEVVEFR